jgi:hypothetical protein
VDEPADASIDGVGTDHVWVAIEHAVSAAFDDKAVLDDPPTKAEDWMWLSASVADRVCAVMPPELYRAWVDLAQPS